jgi:cyclin A
MTNLQGDRIDERTRGNLVVWMDEFSHDYHLPPGTLHRAVSYVDRVLSLRALSSSYNDDTDRDLRLLGAAALFTAAKYESSLTLLDAAEVAGYCGSSTTAKDVTDIEREMLAALRFELGGPTAFTFVEHFTRHSRGVKSNRIRMLAHRLADTSLLDYGCLQFVPSAVAATALFLARYKLEPEDCHELIEDITGYTHIDMMDGIYSLFTTNPNSRFVVRSYRATCRI